MTVVDDLLANPGLYVGLDNVAGVDSPGAARMVVTPLPGRGGVSLDYEVLNPGFPARLRAHAEHTVVARTHDGGCVMVVAHPHALTVAILHETEPGTFELGPEGYAFPMKVEIGVPEPGRIRHAWWYGPPGGVAEERDVSELELVPEP